jgi:hypothetical protein
LVETFDERDTASLNGQNQWRAVAAAGSAVQTNTVFGGSKAASVETSVLWREIDDTATDVLLDCYVQAPRRTSAGDPTPNTNSVIAFYVNSNGYLRVSDSNSWVTLTSFTVPSNEWTRVTARLDYSARTWAIYAGNSISNDLENPLETNLAFRTTGSGSVEGVRVTTVGSGVKSYIDSLTVADHAGSGLPLSVDHGGDGISDRWALHFFNSATNRPNDSDSDNDGWTDRQEYLAGTDPTNATSYMRVVSCDLENETSSNLVFKVLSGGHTVTSIYAGDIIARQYSLRADELPAAAKSEVVSLTDNLTGTNLLTDSGAASLYSARFYDLGVTLGGDSYTNTREWAMHMQPRQADKRYLVTVPVDYTVGSNALDSTLGLQIARGLTPGDQHNAPGADQIRFDDGLSFSTYTLVTNGSGEAEWWDGSGKSSRVIDPGEGFWVLRGNGSVQRTNMVFVGLTRTNNIAALSITTNDMSQGWDAQIFGWPYSESKSTSGHTTDPFGFVSAGAYGGSRSDSQGTNHNQRGDQIWYWDDGWRYIWLVNDGGGPGPDNTWWDSVAKTNADFSLAPGTAYYYRHHVATNGPATGTNFNWQPVLP